MTTISLPNRHAAGTIAAPRRSRGFTLIELLVVISIIAILATLTGPSIVSVFQGSSLTQAGQTLQDQLTYFRQYAIANNTTVEVRFYLYSDPSVDPPTKSHYRAFQAFALKNPQYTSSGNFTYTKTAISRPVRLPSSVIIDSGSISGLISAATGASTTVNPWTNLGAGSSGSQSPAQDGDNPPDPSIMNIGTNYSFIAFQYRPDGSTNLPSGTAGMWSFYLALHSLLQGDGLSTLPANYYMIQVDPIDGHVTTYRP
jgi:uncharacterized protein (TIGR02596 family)